MYSYNTCVSHPKIPESSCRLPGRYLELHCMTAPRISKELLKHCAAECWISSNEGVGPHKQQTCTSGINVIHTNLKAACKSVG